MFNKDISFEKIVELAKKNPELAESLRNLFQEILDYQKGILSEFVNEVDSKKPAPVLRLVKNETSQKENETQKEKGTDQTS